MPAIFPDTQFYMEVKNTNIISQIPHTYEKHISRYTQF
jgi:hypothetical protein